MLDVFNGSAYTVTSLTEAINKRPYKPRRIGALGLFGERGVSTTQVAIEEKDGQLTLIQSSPRGGVGSRLGNPKRKLRSFVIPHFERESTIQADEVQGVRAFGSEDSAQGVQALVDERFDDLRRMHEATHEWLRASALQGIVKDADGSTLFNLFTEFGVSQQTASLNVDPSTDQKGVLLNGVVAAQRLIEEELGDEPVTGYRALCGKDFYDGLRGDASFVEVRKHGARNDELLRAGVGVRTFDFADVVWEEYRGKNGATPYIPDAEAYLYPEGTSYFRTYFAPADFEETVNTIGLPLYAKMVRDKDLNRWTKIHTQSNPLPLCLRPRVVVKLTLS